MRFFWLIAVLLWAMPVNAEGLGPVVLEHFTMSACSDFVRANENVKRVIEERDHALITLGCHVTYGDGRGRVNDFTKAGPYFPSTDNDLSRAFCDTRHAGYRRAGILSHILTPQVVISGKYEGLGTRKDLLDSGLRMARRYGRIAPLTLALKADVLEVALPEIYVRRDVDVWLFAYQTRAKMVRDSDIYLDNAVTYLKKIMVWDGTERQISVPVQDMQADGYAVIVQHQDFTKIMAAGNVER